MGFVPHIGPISGFLPRVEPSPACAAAANSPAEAISPSTLRRRSAEFQPIDEARLGAWRANAAATVFPDATSLISAMFNIPPFVELLAGCLPGSRAGSSLLKRDVGPRDRRAGTVILPASRPMFVPPRDFNSRSSVVRPAPLGRFGRRTGLGSGRPSPGKSANDQAILPPSGSAVRRRRDSSGGARSAHDSVRLAQLRHARRAVYSIVAHGRHPTATMRRLAKVNSCRWRGGRIFQRSYSNGSATALEKIWHGSGSIEND